MSKPSYCNKVYRHFDVTEDSSKNEDFGDERRNILPPHAHASSSPSFISSIISSSMPSRKLPSDVSFIPVGVNYSTSDALNNPLKSFTPDFQSDQDILELPKPVCSVIDINDGVRKAYQNSNVRGSRRSLHGSTIEIDLPSSINPHITPHHLVSAASSSFPHSSQTDVYQIGLQTTAPHRNSSLSVNSSEYKGIPLSGLPTGLTMWETISRKPSSPTFH